MSSPSDESPIQNRRRRRDPRRDDLTRAMIACKEKLLEAEKLPEGPAKIAMQNAAIALLSKDTPKRPDRRKSNPAAEAAARDSELAELARQLFM
jgi:hypothetical protein